MGMQLSSGGAGIGHYPGEELSYYQHMGAYARVTPSHTYGTTSVLLTRDGDGVRQGQSSQYGME